MTQLMAFGGKSALWRGAVLGLMASLMLALPAFAAAGDPSIAKAVTVRPQADGLINGVSKVILADDDLFEGQKITTGAKGQVEIVFADDTHMVVGPGSSLVIEKYLMRNGGTASSFAVNALGGSFRFITGKSPKSAYRIDTPTATIGVRGTKFDFSVGKKDHKTTVVLFDGEVSICQSSGGCKTVSHPCDVGLADQSDTQLIGSGDSKHSSATADFPYVSSQSKLSKDFKIGGANACGQTSEIKNEPKPAAPEPDKPPAKPDPVPDPVPDPKPSK